MTPGPMKDMLSVICPAVWLIPGSVRIVFSGGISWEDMVVQNDGKIIAIGGSSYLADDGIYRSGFGTRRFDSNGALDTSFGTGGIATTRILNFSYAERVTIQADGKIVVLGGATENPGPVQGSDYKSAFARYYPDGTLDQSFGTNGTVIAGSEGCYSILAQPDNKLLCTNRNGISRYNSNGTPDTAFGSNGTAIVDGDLRALQPDGKIVVGGFEKISRFNSDGTLDNSFGTGGSITNAPSAAIYVQPNGKIIAAGSLSGGNPTIFRYTQNGAVDSTFGTNGSVGTPFAGAIGTQFTSLIIQPDNKIVVTGEVAFGICYCSSPVIARFIGDPLTNLIVSGRVLTPDGSGLRNAAVTLTDSQGVVRTATTSSFGFYAFDDVTAGSTYTIAVSSRRYRYASRSLQVNGSLTNVDFVGLE